MTEILRPPLARNFAATASAAVKQVLGGVADGARTHDNRNHNPGLYQLSYSHRMTELYLRPSLRRGSGAISCGANCGPGRSNSRLETFLEQAVVRLILCCRPSLHNL